MGVLTNRAKVLEQKPMSFMERLYLPAILKGMAVTFSHMFKKKATINYPEEKRPFSPVFRGLHVLNRDAEGRENCTACGLCAVACPAEAISMEAAERQPNEGRLYREEKYAAKYEINMLSQRRHLPFRNFCAIQFHPQRIHLFQRRSSDSQSGDRQREF
jgi:NADH-quinone oxidoreductase subunit I